MRDRCQPGLRNLHVVLRRVKARADGPDHLAIDNNRKPALHLGEALRRNGSNATVIDCVLKRLTWLLEQRGCLGLARRKLHAGDIGGMVHALDQDRPPAVIDQSDNSGQVIARRGAAPRQAPENTNIGGPWLNLMCNALNSQIWSFIVYDAPFLAFVKFAIVFAGKPSTNWAFTVLLRRIPLVTRNSGLVSRHRLQIVT
jgi:hypothetical protein